ncbi:ATP binding protein [Sesbania bispinosa]|nr:ATP binding protein [Sesbania bispinosa]
MTEKIDQYALMTIRGRKVFSRKLISGINFSKTPSDSSEPGLDEEVVLDISGRNLEFPASEKVEDSTESLHMYKNLHSLIPESVGGLMRLRTIKFLGDEINLFAPESKHHVVETIPSLAASLNSESNEPVPPRTSPPFHQGLRKCLSQTN